MGNDDVCMYVGRIQDVGNDSRVFLTQYHVFSIYTFVRAYIHPLQ